MRPVDAGTLVDLCFQKPDFVGQQLQSFTVQKTAARIHRVSGHALAVHANCKCNCTYYAPTELEVLAIDAGASALFCQQLVLGFSPDQA